jgi:hypothetical protein
LREPDVVEANHRQIRWNPDAFFIGLSHHAHGRHIVRAKDGSRRGWARKKFAERRYAAFDGVSALHDQCGVGDLFIVQAHVMDTIQINEPHLRYRESPLLLRNEGGKKFVDVSAQSGEVFQQAWASRGMAIGDIDNDGRIDAVVTSLNGPAWVLHNETPTHNHWITLKLVGVKSNRDGIGAQVRISTPAAEQYATVTTASSYQSSSDKRVHFGLGSATSVTRAEIRWPSGIVQILKDLKADQILTVTEANSPAQ